MSHVIVVMIFAYVWKTTSVCLVRGTERCKSAPVGEGGEGCFLEEHRSSLGQEDHAPVGEERRSSLGKGDQRFMTTTMMIVAERADYMTMRDRALRFPSRLPKVRGSRLLKGRGAIRFQARLRQLAF